MKPVSPRYPTYVIYEGYDLALAIESVGKGWEPLVREVFSFMKEHRTHTKVIQVKEKWGGLRIYTDVIDDKLDEKIREVEKRSFTVCELCGAPGNLRGDSWYQTLCETHGQGKPIIEDGKHA